MLSRALAKACDHHTTRTRGGPTSRPPREGDASCVCIERPCRTPASCSASSLSVNREQKRACSAKITTTDRHDPNEYRDTHLVHVSDHADNSRHRALDVPVTRTSRATSRDSLAAVAAMMDGCPCVPARLSYPPSFVRLLDHDLLCAGGVSKFFSSSGVVFYGDVLASTDQQRPSNRAAGTPRVSCPLCCVFSVTEVSRKVFVGSKLSRQNPGRKKNQICVAAHASPDHLLFRFLSLFFSTLENICPTLSSVAPRADQGCGTAAPRLLRASRLLVNSSFWVNST